MDPEELEKLIDFHSKQIASDIKEAAGNSSNEAEFRKQFAKIIEDFAQKADITLDVREEYILARGRADAVYNRLVIEYEPPRSLHSSNNYSTNQHAIGQVKTYIEDVDRRERRQKARLLGIATDGNWFIYVKYKEEKKQPWDIQQPQEINEYSIRQFLRQFASLVSGSALIPDNLERDFGTKSVIARKCVETFYNSLLNSKNDKVEVFFNQWKRHFDQVTGYSEDSTRFSAKDLAFIYGMRGRNFELLPLFFAVHTYYATFIKLLALQIAGHYTFSGLPLKDFAGLISEKLLEELIDLEEGGVFRNVGINNFLEGDFFSWYLEIWGQEIEKSVRIIIEKLNSYDPVTMEVDPELTRDLLKILYQELVPKELRHDLGEYYTPDWLAERLLNQIQYNGDPNKRVLDPACGSGTFLILALKRVREYARKNKIPEKELLEKVLKNIAGIDLNPLAVISARTNFLMAISDLLHHKPKEGINIPVYLADSILTPTEHVDLFTQAYRIKTSVGEFDIPNKIVDNNQIDNLAELLETSVRRKESIDSFLELYKAKVKLSEREQEESKGIVELLYRKLLDLEEKGINHIWARIIKNSFAPLFLGKFDYVIGNPPWINWENLPDDYRNNLIPLYENKYGLFSATGISARLGGAKIELASLFVYVSSNVYLKDGGKLGFVITQSLFKTAEAGRGFRKFKLPDGEGIRILSVDDMVELKPFEGVGNRTSVFISQKGHPTRYPVTYNYWKKRNSGTGIGVNLNLNEVGELATYKNHFAEPINPSDLLSPWITGRSKALQAAKKLVGGSDYYAKPGVCTWLNGVYFVNVERKLSNGNVIIENIGDAGKIKVPSVKVEIESDFIFPLLQGRNIKRWRALGNIHIIVPQDPKNPSKAYPENKLKINFPLTYKYLEKFRNELEKRSGYKKYLSDSPFYAVYNIGKYTFAPFKVVWMRVSNDIGAAVIGFPKDTKLKVIIPIETAVLIPFEDEEEAFYVSAVINARPWRFCIAASSVSGTGGFGSTNVLDKARIPKYNPSNKVHQELVNLSRLLHTYSLNEIANKVDKTTMQLEQTAARIWGLSQAELRDIELSFDDIN